MKKLVNIKSVEPGETDNQLLTIQYGTKKLHRIIHQIFSSEINLNEMTDGMEQSLSRRYMKKKIERNAKITQPVES